MSPRAKGRTAGTMLELWHLPRGAGDPLGCLTTTYTFTPGLFDEQCLARFLGIESEPDREDLAFLLERETRLGGAYAGVLVDHSQAGVAHSLRWDVLPVRVRGAKQHAKLSLLAWSGHVRIVIASANLSEAGYRSNFEVAGAIDLAPAGADQEIATDAIEFLRGLLRFVPGADQSAPAVARAEAFLARVERQVASWRAAKQAGSVRQRLVLQLPGSRGSRAELGVLGAALVECRRRGGAPDRVQVASPFFDVEDDGGRAVTELCKSMSRVAKRRVDFCVPAAGDAPAGLVPRLAAPRTLLSVPGKYGAEVEIHFLPATDEGKNARAWHAKLFSFGTARYQALMIGSSNFTVAGLGIGFAGNVEANLLTVVERGEFLREVGELRNVWPEMEPVRNPGNAEWLGPAATQVEEDAAPAVPIPVGFLAATYCAGEQRALVLALDPERLPEVWSIHAVGRDGALLLDRTSWEGGGGSARVEIPWTSPQPPEKLRVDWPGGVGFLPINVLDGTALPPPAKLEQMTADEMLGILAAADPSAALRSWGRMHGGASPEFEDELDSAVPVDLDPLRHHDLGATFLHRVRRRARVLAQLRANLERPVWGRQALDWRLRGLIGVDALATRLVRESAGPSALRGEALLSLADFLIVLNEVAYAPSDGALPKREFEAVYRAYLRELAGRLGAAVGSMTGSSEGIDPAVLQFWREVEARCRE